MNARGTLSGTASASVETSRPEDTPNSTAAVKLIVLAASLLSIVPVWLSSFPPMCDLPQHAAQIALLRNMHDPSFAYSSLFHTNWFTPYLLGYISAYSLTPLVGIVAAFKIVISLSIAAVPLATAWMLKTIDTDIFWAILTIPGLYGFAYQWGFLNFLVAAPIGIVFLLLFVRFSRTPTFNGAVAIAIGINLLFFCHALVCAFFMTVAAAYALAENPKLKPALIRIAPLLFALPTAALWMTQMRLHPGGSNATFSDSGFLRLTGSFSLVLGIKSMAVAAVAGGITIALPFLAGLHARTRFARWVPFYIYLLMLFYFPSTIFGTDLVYPRFTIFALPVFLFLLDRGHPSRRRSLLFRSAAVLVVLCFIGNASIHASAFNSRVKGFDQVLARMEPGQRVLYFPFDTGDGISIAPTFLHFANWYTALQKGIVDPSAAVFYQEVVVYNPDQIPKAVLLDFEWSPEKFNWYEYHAQQYRYFVLRSRTDRSQQLFSSIPCQVTLRYSSNEWWLYERDITCNR